MPVSPTGPSYIGPLLETPEKTRIPTRMIEGLIGCSMLAANGHVHERQRRVAAPAFSIQNIHVLVPLIFNKGEELKDRWMELIQEHAIKDSQKDPVGLRLDVCHELGYI